MALSAMTVECERFICSANTLPYLYYYNTMHTAITVPTPVDFVFYLRFSAELGTTLTTEFITSTIEIEVVSFVHSEK